MDEEAKPDVYDTLYQVNAQDVQAQEPLGMGVGDRGVETAMLAGVPDLMTRPDVMKKYVKDFVDNPFMPDKDPKLAPLWAFVGRTTKMTYIPKKMVSVWINLFEKQKIDCLMEVPEWEVNWELLKNLNQVEMDFYNAVFGAVGTEKNVMNIRNSITSSVLTSFSNSVNNNPKQGGGLRNWLSRRMY